LNYSYYEYIVVDGASTDGTYETVCRYDREFKRKGIRYCHISEPDGGIYDAMNKSVMYCENNWVIFMNANDSFHNTDVLSKIFGQSYSENVSCIYGHTMNIKGGIRYIKRSCPVNCISYKAPFVHQALFVKREILKKYGFDVGYHIAADFDQFVRMYKGKEIFQQIDVVVANFNLDGISQNNCEEVKREWYRIWKEADMLKKSRFRRWWRMEVIRNLKKSKSTLSVYMLWKQLRRQEIIRRG